MVILHPEHGDDPDRYMTKITTNPIIGGQAYALRNKPNGDCIYLGDTGCTIHAWRPAMCRAYDCRRMYERFMQLPRAERRRALRQNWIDQPKLDVGKRMLELERAALLDDE
jgi:Fe-S-cluster containining protein